MFEPYLRLPRPIHVLCLGTFVNRAGMFLVPFLTLYLTAHLRLGTAFATLAMGVYGLGGLLASLVGGTLADRIGRRAVMLTSLLGGSALLVVFPRLEAPPAILTAVLVFAFVAEMYRPAAAAMIADLTTPEQRPNAYAVMYLSINLGMTVSPIVGGAIAQHSFHWLFFGDAATSTAYAVLLLFAVRETLPSRRGATPSIGAAAAEPHAPLGEVARSILGSGAFLSFCLATHLVSLAYMQSHTSLPLYMQGLGLGPQQYGLVTAVNAAMVVCLQLPFTQWIRRFPRESMLVGSALFTAAGFGLTGLAATVPALAGTVVVWTIGEMMQSPYLQTVVADLAPARMRGSYMGMLTFAFSSALMLGSPLGGLVLERWGAGALWGASAAVALAGAAGYAAVAPAVRRAHAAHAAVAPPAGDH